jgi:hypothetical protein
LLETTRDAASATTTPEMRQQINDGVGRDVLAVDYFLLMCKCVDAGFRRAHYQ